MITIFTDGSARGNPGPGGWGAVIADGKSVREIGGKAEHTTNNRMELTAVIEALRTLGTEEDIVLHTDSEYIVKGITSWVKSWQENNWRTSTKKSVLNKDLWEQLIEVVEGKEIKWFVVPGHAGIIANERCDEIATAFADRINPHLYNGKKVGYTVSLASHAQVH